MKKATRDYHKSRYMVRVSEKHHKLLGLIKERTGRPSTVTVQIQIEKAAKRLGIKFRPDWPNI